MGTAALVGLVDLFPPFENREGWGSPPRRFVLTRGANHALAQNWIAADNRILVEAHNYKSGILPFYTQAIIADEVRELHCVLAIEDTEGAAAAADFVLARID